MSFKLLSYWKVVAKRTYSITYVFAKVHSYLSFYEFFKVLGLLFSKIRLLYMKLTK